MPKAGHNAKRYDPTHTSYISKAWLQDIGRRFASLRAAIHQEFEATRSAPHTNAAGDYRYLTNPEKLEHFKRWIKSRVDAKLIEVTDGTPMSVYKGKWWAGKYIQTSYKKGMIRAIQELRNAKMENASRVMHPKVDLTSPHASMALDVQFLAPIHADRVAMLYGRSFEGMKGISDDMSNRLSGLLAEGMASGLNPHDTAERIDKTLDVGKARANTIARTETIRAHHVGSINTYRQAGVEGVRVLAELLTVSGDKENFEEMHVCEECAELQEQTSKEPLSLDEIEPMIPVHPNCRCLAVPVVVNENDEPIAPVEEQAELDLE